MKIKTLITLSALTILMMTVLTGCDREEKLSLSVMNKVTLKASAEINSPATKVGFEKASGNFYWSFNDILGVTNTDATFYPLDLDAEDKGKATGKFTGDIPKGIGSYAVYPYNENHSVSGNMLTYDFPANYIYDKVDEDYFTTPQGDGNSFNAPMWGAIADGSVQMKHLGGVFCIKIGEMPCASGTLTLTSDMKISGTYANIDLSAADPAITAAVAATDEEKTVSIAFSNATVGSPGVFYVPAPVGIHNVTVILKDSHSAEQFNESYTDIDITRRTLKIISEAFVNIPDANFKASLIYGADPSGAVYDKNDDGEISYSEAEQITNIRVNTDDIESLEGIEFMPNLEYLSIKGSCNEDEEGFPIINEDGTLTTHGKLTSLNLSGNTKLKGLWCGCNQLQELDLSQNMLLEEFDCSINRLTQLDVSNHETLRNFNCASNGLTSLNVSGCSTLLELGCWANQLTSLDVSSCTALTSLLMSVTMPSGEKFGNRLKGELDISNNINLEEFDVTDNPDLEIIYVWDSFDIENPPADFHKDDTAEYKKKEETGEFVNIPDPNFKAYLIDGTDPITNVKYDQNGDGKISYSEAEAIIKIDVCTDNIESLEGIEAMTNLKYLSACGTISESHANGKLTELDVSNNTALTTLFCDNNQLTSLDVSNNTALTYLICGFNQLTSLDVSNNTALKTLDCRYNQLTSLDVSNNTKLTKLWCNNNQLTGELDISNNINLTSLYVTNNLDLKTIYVWDSFDIANPPDDFHKDDTAEYKKKGDTNVVPVTGVFLDRADIALKERESYTLTATVTPEDATNRNVSWSSDNTSVATVDKEGKVTAVSAGSATITVTTEDGGKTATCTVTVTSLSYIWDGTYSATFEKRLRWERDAEDKIVNNFIDEPITVELSIEYDAGNEQYLIYGWSQMLPGWPAIGLIDNETGDLEVWSGVQLGEADAEGWAPFWMSYCYLGGSYNTYTFITGQFPAYIMSRDGDAVNIVPCTHELNDGTPFTVNSLDIYAVNGNSISFYALCDCLAGAGTMTKTSSSPAAEQMNASSVGRPVNLRTQKCYKVQSGKALSVR